MKRLPLILLLIMAIPCFAGDIQTASITAQNHFTSPVQVRDSATWGAGGSSWSATVVLQCCIPEGSETCLAVGSTWVDTGDTLTAPGANVILDGNLLYYRVGVKTGGFTSGTVPVWIRSKF